MVNQVFPVVGQLKITPRKPEGAFFNLRKHWSFRGKLNSSLQSLVDWTSGLDWWTGLVDWTGGLTFYVLKTTFVLFNETSLSCRFSNDAF